LLPVLPDPYSRIRSWDRAARRVGSNVAGRISAGLASARKSATGLAIDGFELAITLDRLPYLRCLPVERLGAGPRLRLGKEALGLVSVPQRVRSGWSVAYRQCLTGWNHRKIPGHHAPTVKFFAAHTDRSHPSGAKAVGPNRGDSFPHSLIYAGKTQVGITVP
jgi:hypothetical protein